MTPVKVSIVITVFNRVEYSRACLAALYRNTGIGQDFLNEYPDRRRFSEVIVLDNGSTDGTAAFLEEAAGKYPGLRVIRHRENLGYARANNRGARLARGKYLLFLNNDTEPQTGWFPPLLDILQRDESAAAAGGKLLYPDGTIQHAGVVILKNSALDAPPGLSHIYAGQPGNLDAANQPHTYQILTAACLLVRREIFEALGGFDEHFWNGYEDVDLCLKIGQQGKKLVYQPRSRVIHHESASGAERFAKASKNLERFREIWADTLIPDFIKGPRGPYRRNPESPIAPYDSAVPLNKTLPLRYLPPDYVSADYVRSGEHARARGNGDWRSYYRKALALLLPRQGKTPREIYRIASIYKHLNRFETARQWFSGIPAGNADLTLAAGAYFHLGEMEYAAGRKESARALFLKTLALNPQHRKAREYLNHINEPCI